MVAQREAWSAELIDLAEAEPELVVLDGDLGTSTKADRFAQAHPQRFLQMGIAEQNMVGVAAGMAEAGAVPWVSSFGVFLTQRALDQMRMLVSQTGANVKLAGHYTGLLNGGSGKTHQDIEDLAVLRAMPEMTVIAPADGAQTRQAVRWATAHRGPVYLRLARDDAGELDLPAEGFGPDRLLEVRPGPAEVTVISTGVQTARTAQAVGDLAEQGLVVRHLHAPFLKPLRPQTISAALVGTQVVVTVEEHSIIGGLGGLVAEAIATTALSARLTRIGLADAWSESAPNDHLLDAYGLSPERVADQIKKAATQPHRQDTP